MLIVEDDVLIAWGVEAALRGLGFDRIVIASTGGSAMEAAETTKFGLIVSDLNLGPLTVDGIQLLGMIDPDELIPTIVHTAYNTPDIIAALDRGRPRAHFLVKPALDALLAETVVRALQCEPSGPLSAPSGSADPQPDANPV